MLHKLSLDANSMAMQILLASTGIAVYIYIFIWRANIARIPHYDVLLSNSMVWPMEVMCVQGFSSKPLVCYS